MKFKKLFFLLFTTGMVASCKTVPETTPTDLVKTAAFIEAVDEQNPFEYMAVFKSPSDVSGIITFLKKRAESIGGTVVGNAQEGEFTMADGIVGSYKVGLDELTIHFYIPAQIIDSKQ